MVSYSYKGIDSKSGSAKKGTIDADSVKLARQKLRAQGVMVTTIKEKSGNVAKATGKLTLWQELTTPKATKEDLAIMTRQFATLQRAAVPLDESLDALKKQVDSRALQGALAGLHEMIKEGRTLADACKQYPATFNRLYVNMVRAGETAGTLGTVLDRLADFLEYEVKIKGQVQSAMMYPILMILASFGIIGYLFTNVVPKLTKVFDSLKMDIPGYTKLLFAISDFLVNQWYMLVFGIGFIFLAIRSWLATKGGRRAADNFMLTAPLFGDIVLRLNVSKFTRTLSTLLSSGVPIIEALEITRNIVTNSVLSNVLEESKVAVQEGESLGATIGRSGRFPSLVTHMIQTGEKTGELENMLGHVATAYDSEVERKISGLISLITPLLIVFMAAIVGFVVIAMLVPMLNIMKQVR